MKDYKKILEGVVNIISTTEKSDIGFANICTYIGENCPELKESEDERMVKFIKKQLFNIKKTITENYVLDAKLTKAIDWLEKQGQTFTKKDVDDAYLKGVCDTKQELEKQGEQKPAWSEEDEKLFNKIGDLIHTASFENCETDDVGKELGEYAKMMRLLKSLKERYTWKPSDEQMKALDDFIYAKYPNIEKYGAAVKSLYQDLKKLREE